MDAMATDSVQAVGTAPMDATTASASSIAATAEVLATADVPATATAQATSSIAAAAEVPVTAANPANPTDPADPVLDAVLDPVLDAVLDPVHNVGGQPRVVMMRLDAPEDDETPAHGVGALEQELVEDPEEGLSIW